MKKVMFGFAALAATVAMADIQSANTVGFENRDLTANEQVIDGANFVTVGESSLDIQSIKMNSGCTDGGAEIWWWNGSTYDAHAYWYNDLYADEEGVTTLGYAGWGDGLYWMPVSKTFAPGESFWIQANGADATMTVAGEVASCTAAEQYYGIDLTANAQVQLSNPFPTGALDIQSIKMADGCTDGGAEIWWWNGATYDAHAYWYNDLYADEEGITTLGYAGWGDGLYWMPITKTFAAGQGFWIQANGANATVKFANPFYKAAE